jgi:catalase
MPSDALPQQLIDALDALFGGPHPGFRPAHAKGVQLTGTFAPSPDAAKLTKAPHAARPSTPVIVRFSDSTGVPTIPDNDPAKSGPRGFAVRFYLAEHTHTDIIGHSTDGFPTRTGEEFLEFLRAAAAGQAAVGAFLAAHPAALRFATAPKPIPSSFAREAYFAVTAFRFTNKDGESRVGRFRVRPKEGVEHLTAEAAAAKSPNFLFEEIARRVAKGPIELGVSVQVAEAGDVVDDATVAWPAERAEVPFGTLTLTALAPDDEERRKIIYDPVPRVEGIDLAGDPLNELRAEVYLASGRRRRAAGAK